MLFVLPKLELLIPFLAAVALSELTPGPNMGYLAIVAARWGRFAGFAAVAGVALGLAAYLAAAATGIAQAAITRDWLYETLRWAGVAYLIWLSTETWRNRSAAAVSDVGHRPSAVRLLGRSLLANVLNPKAALFYAVLLPSFTDANMGQMSAQILALGLIHIAVATSVHLVIVVTASNLRPALAGRVTSDRLVARVMGAGLFVVACWLAWETRRA